MSKKFVSNKDETVRMFENDFLESLTKIHFSVPLILYVPIIGYFIFLSATTYEKSVLIITGLFLAGFFFWSVFEYILHRYIFHYEPKSKFGKRVHFIFHGVHHDYPNDSMRLVMPPIVSLTLFVVFYFIYKSIFGLEWMHSFYAGFIFGYLIYDIGHYAMHHFNIRNRFWLKIKRHHMLHHYKDEHKGYGVSFPFWDKIFKTDFEKKK